MNSFHAMAAAPRRAFSWRASLIFAHFSGLRRSRGIFVALILPFSATLAEPLHLKVDAAMDAARAGLAAPPADDAEFLRRAWLALTGSPPSADETREFFADKDPDKRAKIIATLTASPDFIRHLAVQIDVMLMERRAEMHSKAADWRRWLEESLAAGKPWDQLVREILAADGSDEKTRHIARWILERQAEPNLLARDAGRLFLARDMACAQCHDHPRIDDYAQSDYHGLLAFFGRTSLFQPDTNKPAMVAEAAAGEAEWTSVFTKISGSSRPRLPGGGEIDEPAIAEADKWVVAPAEKDKNVRPVPKYSRRARLADVMVTDPAFRRNIANRLWGMVMGRCLVEPPDLMHSGNAPAHPAVLELLGDEIAVLKFDLRAFVRELALTKTFAQAFDPAPVPAATRDALTTSLPERVAEAARSKAESDRLSVAFTECGEALEEVHNRVRPAIDEWKKATAAYNEAQKAAAAAMEASQKAEDAKRVAADSARVLREAAEAGAAASLTSPDDKELAAATKTFQDKLSKAANDEAAADKDIAPKKAAAEAKSAEAEKARLAAEAKKPAADDANRQIAAAMQKLNEADAAKRTARVAAQQSAQKVSEAQAMLAFATAAETAAPLLHEANKARTGLDSIRKSIAGFRTVIESAGRELAAMEKAAAEGNAAVIAFRQNAEAAGVRAAALTNAAGKAAVVATKLPSDTEVQTAAKTIQSKADQAAGEKEKARKALTDAENAAAKVAGEITARKQATEKARAELAAAEANLPAAQNALAEAEAKASASQSLQTDAQQAVAAVATGTFGVSSLAPVPPEPLCWSLLKVTGTIDQLRESAAKEWDDKNKPSDADKADPAKQAARAAAIEALTRDKMKPHEDQFVRLFANGAGQPQDDFFATADQVLYFENAGALRSWTNPSGNNLAARLAKIADPNALAEELYLSVLTRLPSGDEANDIAAILASQPPDKKAAAVSDAIWALLTASEFRFRH